MKVMISMPMNGRKNEEVEARMKKLKEDFAKLHIDVVDSFITDEIENSNHPGVYYLGRTLMNFMHDVDAVYFDEGWIEARGCRIENAVCQEYGIKILDFNFLYGPKLKRIMNPPMSPEEQLRGLKAVLKDNPQLKDEIEPQIQQLEQIIQEKIPNKTSNLRIIKGGCDGDCDENK